MPCLISGIIHVQCHSLNIKFNGPIRNPIPELLSIHNAAEIIQSRIATFSDLLNVPRTRIADWCFVQAVLSWVWALEDCCDTEYWARLVEIFDSCRIS